MAVVSVTFDGATRVNAADAATNWSNLSGGGPAPASEAQLRYQGSGAVNRKVTSTSARQGVEYDPGSGGVDTTAAANRLWFCKVYVADFGDLNATYGVEVRYGSGVSAYYAYCVAGTNANRSVFDAYPAKGGYLIVAIDPSVSGWREATSGSPSLTAMDYFGVAAQFVVGGAKSENVAMDAIDIGRGLLLVGGSGADPVGTFIDFLTADQDNTSNRWGVVDGVSPVINARGLLTIGSATETDFEDLSSTVLFVDGYHGPGHVGTLVDIQNASSVINVGATLIGLGSSATSDTRPDYTVSGTSGTHTLSGVLTNHRNVVLTSVVDVDGADIQCDDLAQNGAEIQNSTIRTTTAAGVAVCNDATFGTTTDLHDTEFVQEGSGHAIEFTSTGARTLTNMTWTGYGADETNSAAIRNNSGGLVTLTIAGGTTPTVDDVGASSTVLVLSPVTSEITVSDETGALFENVRVLLEAGDGAGDLPFEDTVTITRSGATASVSHTAHNMSNGDLVAIRGANEREYNIVAAITNVTANAYDYTVTGTPDTPATGTINATGVIISGSTSASGVVSSSNSFTVDQVVRGVARKASTGSKYKTFEITGTIDKDTGFSLAFRMQLDE